LPKLPGVYRSMLTEHRRRLDRLVDRQGLVSLKKLYANAQSELERQLRVLPKRLGNSFTAHHSRIMLAQVKQGRMMLAQKMAGEMAGLTRQAQTESLRGLIVDLTTLEREFTGADVVLPIEDAALFQGVIDGRRESLLRTNDESLAYYTADVVEGIEDDLSLALAIGETTSDTIDRVMDGLDNEWWQAERIVRTETLWAANSTQADGLEASAEVFDDLHMRWEEYVDDSTGQPLDERVDDDSLAMHGQIIRPGGQFYFPDSYIDRSDPKVAKRLERFRGQSWAFPPMRPQDRATVSPVRPGWGIPGWQWVDGDRVVWPV